MFVSCNLPRHPTSARYRDFVARIWGRAVGRISEVWKAFSELSLFKIQYRIFTEGDILSEKVVKVVRKQRIICPTSVAKNSKDN